MVTMGIVTAPSLAENATKSILRNKCQFIDFGSATAGEQYSSLALDMFETMYAADGAGLAAPQVGIAICMFVIDPAGMDFGPHVCINPVLLSISDDTEVANEGCLSLPQRTGRVARATGVVVRAHTLTGAIEEYHATGWLARVFQHELDHLNGVLYPDRLPDASALVAVDSGARRRATAAMRQLTASTG